MIAGECDPSTAPRLECMSSELGSLLPAVQGVDRIAFELPDVTLGGYLWRPSHSADHGPSTMVVLLHGWGEDASELAPVGVNVADMGVHAISLSMRGWRGSTGVADYGRSDPDDIRRVAAAIRYRFGMERVVLIGFSMGGLVALLTAATDPDSSSTSDPDPSGRPIDGVVAVSSPVELRSFYSDTAYEGVRRYLDETLTEYQWKLCSPLRCSELITCPVLIVVGSRDEMCPPDQGRRLLKELGCAQIAEFGDMEHHPSSAHWNDILQRARRHLRF